MKIIKTILLCFILSNIYGQSTIHINKGETILTGKQSQFLIDTTNTLQIDEVIHAPFSPVSTDILNLSFLPHTAWIRFNIQSDSNQEIYLEIGQALMEELEVFEVQGDSLQTTIFSGGFKNEFNQRLIKSENWLFSIPLIKGQEKSIYIKGRTGFPFQIPITVAAKDKYLEGNQQYMIFWGLYMGIMFFALMYNLFLFISIKEQTLFYYLLYIIGSTTFYLGLYGYTFRYLWPDSPNLNPLLPIIICLTNIAITLFTISFLRITKTQKVSYYGSWAIMIGFGLIAILNIAGPYGAAVGLSQMLSLVTALFFIYMGISAWRRDIPTARFYLVAWVIYLVLVIIFLLTDNNVLPSNFFTRHCILIGHMAEVILLSFALADRINWLKRENEDKQIQIITQLEENERITLQANRELEQKVTERTAEVVEQRNEAVKQRERSDSLLLNILPAETAEELKQTGTAKAKFFENVTVIFVDVEDFTKTAENMSPTELVEHINELFTEFDSIAELHKIEKIKTIGDAYMAAGGLPSENATHATDVVNAAIDFQKAIQKLEKDKFGTDKIQFKVRIGVHTGPVVAGVVGKKKFAYDIWGDTVNIASRMESACTVGKINVSQQTYNLTKDQFQFTKRGKVEAKSLGKIDMYYVDN